MRRSRMVAALGVVALATTALGATAATAAPQSTTTTAPAARAGTGTYVVLADRVADVDAVVARLRSAGATVVSVNRAIGLVTVKSTAAGFASTARDLQGVSAAARDGVVGRTPDARPTPDRVLREHQASAKAKATKAKKGASSSAAPSDPLDYLPLGHGHDQRAAGARAHHG